MKIKTYLKYLQTFDQEMFFRKAGAVSTNACLEFTLWTVQKPKILNTINQPWIFDREFFRHFEFSVSKSKKSFQIMLMCDKKMICNWWNKGFCLYVYFSNIAIVCSKATITIVSLIFWPRAVFCASSRSWTFQFLFFTWFFFNIMELWQVFFSFVLYCSYVQYTFNLKLKTDKLQLSDFFFLIFFSSIL